MELVDCEYLGHRIKVIKNDQYVSRCALNGGWWDNWMLATVSMAASRNPGLFIDIGANIGLNSIMFSQFADVYAFEPVFYDILQDNVSTTARPVKVFPFPLSNISGPREIFMLDPQEGGLCNYGATSFHVSGTRSKVVDTQRLDDMGIDVPVSFIKIDVEHHEYEVLEGAQELIKKNSPVMCIESFDRDKLEAYRKSIGYTQIYELPECNYVIMP